jgi:DNA polymerase-3 subunit delta'
VIPTIRSRCRHLTLRTPSIKAVTQLLIERDGIDPKMAEFAASAAQGHIGRAKYLASNENARKVREKILNIPSTLTDLASAFEAANTLLEMAKEQVKVESETRDEAELTKLKESYGSTGSRLATGGSKAVKELEKEQKVRTTRRSKNFIDHALLELQEQFHKKLSNQLSDNYRSDRIIYQIEKIEESRSKLLGNSSSIIVLESLFCEFYMGKNQ